MVDWKKLLKPIQDGAENLPILVRRVVSPPPEPTLEEFVSPLQAELKERLHVKHDIGYNANCAECHKQKNIDGDLTSIVDTAANPEPWLAQLHTELVLTRTDLKDYRAENTALRKELDAVRSDVNPIKRMLYLFGAGLAGLGAKALWDLWLQQQIINLIPQGLMYFKLLLGL